VLFLFTVVIIDRWRGTKTFIIDRITIALFIGIFIVWFIFNGWWVLSKIFASIATILAQSPIDAISLSSATIIVLPSLIQKIFFLIITCFVIAYVLMKYRKTKVFPVYKLSWIIASAMLFGLFIISGGFFIDRVGLFMYFITSIVLAEIIVVNRWHNDSNMVKQSKSSRAIRIKIKPFHFVLALLLITCTFYWNESPVITAENDVNGIELAFQLADNNISLDFFQKQSYLLIPQSRRDELTTSVTDYHVIANSNSYNHSVILFSDNAEWVSKYVRKDHDVYTLAKTNINLNTRYNKFFESGGMQIFVSNY
jgi:hypothetical protein